MRWFSMFFISAVLDVPESLEGSAKFTNFHGLPCARLNAGQSVYTEDTGFFSPLSSSLTFILNAILFRAPQAHFRDLRRVFVDESYINMPRWEEFNRSLVAEWNGVTTYVCIIGSESLS